MEGRILAGCSKARSLLLGRRVGRGELLHVAHAAREDRRDLGVGLPALLGLVGDDRRLHEPAYHALQGVVGALELGCVMDGPGRTRLAAEAAVNALAEI